MNDDQEEMRHVIELLKESNAQQERALRELAEIKLQFQNEIKTQSWIYKHATIAVAVVTIVAIFYVLFFQ